MNEDDARLYVTQLYNALLKRDPKDAELDNWAGQIVKTNEPVSIFRRIIDCPEYAKKRGVSSIFPPGHFHSPVVDPATIEEYYARSRAGGAADVLGIELDAAKMLKFWDRNLAFIKTTPFTEEKTKARRFFYQGAPYPWGDAITLRAMIAAYRPTKIIEIGSGFTTACMLDSADELHHSVKITCIEPYPDRLHSLLRPEDYKHVDVIPSGLQAVQLSMFDDLEDGDILFIDSTHVLKTGSDVHYELFGILPRIKPGVLIHFHDCPFPFEYPSEWVIDRNYSWNEAYALRAFLMYNPRFSVLFWSSFLARVSRSKLLADYPQFLLNPGTSIWLSVQ